MLAGKTLLKNALVLSLLLLVGCTTLRPPTPTAPLAWSERQAQLSRIQNWQLSGRFSIRTPRQSALASLLWQQQLQQYQITLFAPLSLNTVKITGTPGRVTLWKTATQSISATTPEQLLQQAVGWQLPISNLYYWVRNLPAPIGPAQKTFDAAGHIVVLQQQGWIVRYTAFKTIHQIDLPAQMELSSPAIQVRLVISQWQLLR